MKQGTRTSPATLETPHARLRLIAIGALLLQTVEMFSPVLLSIPAYSNLASYARVHAQDAGGASASASSEGSNPEESNSEIASSDATEQVSSLDVGSDSSEGTTSEVSDASSSTLLEGAVLEESLETSSDFSSVSSEGSTDELTFDSSESSSNSGLSESSSDSTSSDSSIFSSLSSIVSSSESSESSLSDLPASYKGDALPVLDDADLQASISDDAETLLKGDLLKQAATNTMLVGEVKLAELHIPDTQEGQPLTNAEALKALLSVSVTKQDLETSVIKAVIEDDADLSEAVVAESEALGTSAETTPNEVALRIASSIEDAPTVETALTKNISDDILTAALESIAEKAASTSDLSITRTDAQTSIRNAVLAGSEGSMPSDLTQAIKANVFDYSTHQLNTETSTALDPTVTSEPSSDHASENSGASSDAHNLESASSDSSVSVDGITSSDSSSVTSSISSAPETSSVSSSSTYSAFTTSASEATPIITAVVTKNGQSFTLPTSALSFRAGSVVLVVNPIRHFKPGIYELTVTITNPLTSETTTLTQNFSWGVLALNANQDVYLPNTEARFDIGVLNDAGLPVCDAELSLVITTPTGTETTLSTIDETIMDTKNCSSRVIGNITPDYFANYTFGEVGIYTAKLTAQTENGTRVLVQSIPVEQSPFLIISRTSATRLYPFGPAPMTLGIHFMSDFVGEITEIVPSSFVISAIDPTATISTLGENTSITWHGSWVGGEKASFSYLYDAPDNSPDFFTTGPLTFHSSISETSPVAERRVWQIANDAIVEKIWTNGAGDRLWSTAGNWSPSGAPEAGTIVHFSGAYTTDSVYLDSNVNVASISAKGFTGATISSGSILASNYGRNITVTGSITLHASRLQMGTGTWVVYGNFSGTSLQNIQPGLSTLIFTGSTTHTLTLGNTGAPIVYQDVPSTIWYASTLTTLGNLGIISGYKTPAGNPIGKYGPADTLTIAQFVKMVTLAAGLEIPTDTKGTPNPKDWSAPYFAALNAKGKNIMTNLKASDIAKPITRGEMAELITFAFNVSKATPVGTLFRDLKTTTSYASSLETLRFYCVIWGDDFTEDKTGKRTVRANAPLNRAEVTAVLVRAMKRFNPSLVTSLDTQQAEGTE